MVFTEQQLQVKKLVDVQQDIEIDALNDGVGALSSTMQNGFTEAANNFSDIQNSLEVMNLVANDRYNGLTGSVNSLSNAMTQGFLDMGNTVANVSGEVQGQFNDVNIELQNIQNNFELVNTNIGESINAYNDQITNSLSVDTLSANTLIYNISAPPVSSLTALGYDSNGRVIPVTVIANQNIVLPENAKYLYTDSVGTPYAGMVDNEVSESENLITSFAVHNFALNISNAVSGLENAFNGVNNNLSGIDNTLYFVMNSLGLFTHMNYINSISPVNYQALDNVVFTKGNMGNLWSETSLLGNMYYDWNSTTKTLTFSSPTGIITFNSDMSSAFAGCSNLNHNIVISNNVTNMSSTFYGCPNLNQDIVIPNSVTDMSSAFYGCSNLNQRIVIPNSVINMSSTFYGCSNLSLNIVISNSVTNMCNTFYGCSNLNQNILISNRVTNMSNTFAHCSSLNQSIVIPNSVTNINNTFFNCSNLNQNIVLPNNVFTMGYTFSGCSNLNQNIVIPNSVFTMEDTFSNCSSLNQNILMPNRLTMMADTFFGCSSLNQNILIPNSVTMIGYTFFNCSSLNQNILIPNRVTMMDYAFSRCYNLNQNILIPDSVTSMSGAFFRCYNLNQNIYLYSDKIEIDYMENSFKNCSLLSDKYIHIRSSIPLDTSNYIYNSLVNNYTGINWSGRVVNDLPTPTTWPPVN